MNSTADPSSLAFTGAGPLGILIAGVATVVLLLGGGFIGYTVVRRRRAV